MGYVTIRERIKMLEVYDVLVKNYPTICLCIDFLSDNSCVMN